MQNVLRIYAYKKLILGKLTFKKGCRDNTETNSYFTMTVFFPQALTKLFLMWISKNGGLRLGTRVHPANVYHFLNYDFQMVTVV